MRTANNLLRDSIAALRGVGSGITRFAHEPTPKLRFRALVYLTGMPRPLCSVRLALEPLATVLGGSNRAAQKIV